MPANWTTAANELSLLEPPFLPMIGNHDVWAYFEEYEEPYPTGSGQFLKTFGHYLGNHSDIYEFTGYQPVFPLFGRHFVYLQNFLVKMGGVVFLALDLNTREHALWPWKGTLPTASLHDYPNGTIRVLERWVGSPVVQDAVSVVLLTHHPLQHCPVEIIACLPIHEEIRVAEVLRPIKHKIWGDFAGHVHRWWQGKDYRDYGYEDLTHWETDAVKLTGAVTLVHVVDDKIVTVEKLCG